MGWSVVPVGHDEKAGSIMGEGERKRERGWTEKRD
jgi:hypothetical protein